MEKIIDNEFNEISFDKEISLHCHIVKAASSKMFIEGFKAMLITWRETVFRLQPQLLLIDNRKQLFPISPDLQAWITEEIGVPVMALPHVKKACYIMPEDFITKLSMSQLKKEVNEITSKTQMMFSTWQEAETWLKAV